MATRTPTRRGKSGRKRVSRTTTKATRTTRGRAGSTRKRTKRTVSDRFAAFRERLRHHLGRQTDDVWGMVLVVLAVLLSLAFIGQAGPAGRWTLAGLTLLFGLWSYAVPVALAALGVMLIMDGRRSPSGRIATGMVLAFVGTLALFHLMTGSVSLSASLEMVKARGGAVGSLLAFPLRRVVGFWGAFVILFAMTAAGLLILTRTTVRQVALALAEIVTGVRAWARRTRIRRPEVAPVRPATPKPQPKHRAVAEQRPSRSSRPAKNARPKNTKKKAKPGPGQTRIPLPDPNPGEGYQKPPLELLQFGSGDSTNRRGLEETARQLEDALAQHGVDARLTKIVPGPTVTRYEIELGPGVKVARVTSLSHDIAYALATPDIRLLAPIPGKSAIGVEVPNRRRRLITLGDVLRSETAQEDPSPLAVGLGLDISGNPKMLHLDELPHVLIAGATGAGKSSCINSMVTSLLMRTSPEDVRLIMVDPKRVELGQYNGVPHLLTKVITNPKKAADALQWAVAEMDRRYELVADAQVRDIIGYREKWDAGLLDKDGFDRFPYIVVIVDELNDLMMVAGKQVESAVVRIAQMARAVGIHLVIATQRPSVDVITGVIKANVPSRLAFSVASMADSRVILDTGGAEKLIGMGDMLVVTATHPRPERIQGAWVGEDEVHAVVDWVKRQREAQYQDKVIEAAVEQHRQQVEEEEGGEDARLLREAMELVVRSQLGSTSMLQRKLRVGFARAGRLMDMLEQRGIVGPSEGSKARRVLMTVEELEDLLASRSTKV